MKEKSEIEKRMERVRRAHSRVSAGQRKNALRASGDLRDAMMKAALARASHRASLPVGQITVQQARTIDARTLGTTQLNLF